MVSIQEKLDFIKTIPTASADTVDRQSILHDLLMRDTNAGKLFKYRAVTKHNLDCLKSGTMFCATPDVFNDPFDSNIGYTIQSLIDAKLELELDRILAIFNHFISVFDGVLLLADCPKDEQLLIQNLLSNKRISAFVKLGGLREYTEDEQREIIKNNTDAICSFIESIMGNEILAPYMPVLKSVMPNILQRIRNGEMQIGSGDLRTIRDFAKANGISEDLDEIGIIRQLIRVIAPEKEHELESFNKAIRFADERCTNAIISSFRIGCLATDFKNRLMWSHYANSHKGFCIEYDFSGTDSFTMSNLPLPIIYSAERPLVSWKAMIEKTPENIADANRHIAIGLFTKDKAWQYENEWRVLIKGTDSPILQMPPITCIYFGACMPEHNKKLIINIALSKGITVKQMVIDRGAFELHAQDII